MSFAIKGLLSFLCYVVWDGISIPLLFDLTKRVMGTMFSPWYVGMVDVLIPFPMPVMTRPTMNWPRLCGVAWVVTCMMTPKIIVTPPSIIARRRPIQSPKVRIKMAPNKHPKSSMSAL